MLKGSRTFTPADTGPLPESWNQPTVSALEEDGTGNLWFGGTAGIGRIDRDGWINQARGMIEAA